MPTMSSSVPRRPDVQAVGETPRDLVDSPAAGPIALRGSAMRGVVYTATIGLSVISVPLLIRHLGIADFGRYSIVISIVTIGAGLTDAGLVSIAVREWLTQSGPQRANALRSLLGIRLELSVAGAAIGTGFALVAGYGSVLVLGTVIAGAGMVLQALANLVSAPLQGELRFGRVAVIDLLRQVVAVAVIVALVLAGAGLLPFFTAGVVSGLAMLVFAGALVRGRMPLRPRIGGTDWWPLVRDALPYSAATAVYTVYFRVTLVVMSLIASAQQTGYFATSFRVVEAVIGLPAVGIATAFPILLRAAAEDSERFAYASERLLELALLAGVALALVLVLGAPFVVDVLAGAHGSPATPVLQIQALSLIATCMVLATSFSLLALRRHAELLIANAAALAANIALTFVLVPIAHARGAALGGVIAEFFLAAGQLALLLRSGRLRMRFSTVPIVALAGLAAAAPLLVHGVHPVLRTLAGIGIYLAVITSLRRLPPELAHALQRRHGRSPRSS